MPTSADYDVIIVGGGIAGSTAGYLLTKLGIKTLIVDKALFPRKKLCGGMITLKSLHLIKKIFGETYSSLKEKNIISYATKDFEINFLMANGVISNTEYPFIFVDRTVYDNFLLQKAKDIGTDVLEGQKIKSIDIDECKVVLFDKKSDGTLDEESEVRIFEADFLIGADGVNSIVRREFYRKGLFKRKDWERNVATTVETFIDRKDLEKGTFLHPIMSMGIIKYGFAWMFPNKEKLVVGLGGLTRKNRGNFVNALDDWVSLLNLNSKPIEKEGHLLHYGIPRIKPVYDGKIFLIGDAGGFVCPLTGEGIYLAKKTAELVATSIYNNLIDKKSIEKAYLWNLKKIVLPEIKSAKRLRFLCFGVGRLFNYKLLKILVKRLTKSFIEVSQGQRSFKWLKKRNFDLLEFAK